MKKENEVPTRDEHITRLADDIVNIGYRMIDLDRLLTKLVTDRTDERHVEKFETLSSIVLDKIKRLLEEVLPDSGSDDLNIQGALSLHREDVVRIFNNINECSGVISANTVKQDVSPQQYQTFMTRLQQNHDLITQLKDENYSLRRELEIANERISDYNYEIEFFDKRIDKLLEDIKTLKSTISNINDISSFDNIAEAIAEAADRIDNLVYAIELTIPHDIHINTLKLVLPELRDQLRQSYVTLTGQNPWEV